MKVPGFEISRFYIFPKSASSSVSELRPTGCETVPCLLFPHLHAFALGFIQSACFSEKSVSIYNTMWQQNVEDSGYLVFKASVTLSLLLLSIFNSSLKLSPIFYSKDWCSCFSELW